MKRYMKTLCLGLMLMLSASAMAQNQTVTGTVLDEAGEPVIGATVTVTGTKTATIPLVVLSVWKKTSRLWKKSL